MTFFPFNYKIFYLLSVNIRPSTNLQSSISNRHCGLWQSLLKAWNIINHLQGLGIPSIQKTGRQLGCALHLKQNKKQRNTTTTLDTEGVQQSLRQSRQLQLLKPVSSAAIS